MTQNNLFQKKLNKAEQNDIKKNVYRNVETCMYKSLKVYSEIIISDNNLKRFVTDNTAFFWKTAACIWI